MPVYRKGKDRWRVVIFQRGQRTDFLVKGSKEEAEAEEARERVKMSLNGPAEQAAHRAHLRGLLRDSSSKRS